MAYQPIINHCAVLTNHLVIDPLLPYLKHQNWLSPQEHDMLTGIPNTHYKQKMEVIVRILQQKNGRVICDEVFVKCIIWSGQFFLAKQLGCTEHYMQQVLQCHPFPTSGNMWAVDSNPIPGPYPPPPGVYNVSPVRKWSLGEVGIAVEVRRTRVPSNEVLHPTCIIYSKDDDPSNHVCDLSDFLNHCGVDCDIDQYHACENILDWGGWIETMIKSRASRKGYVLLVCSPRLHQKLSDLSRSLRIEMRAGHISNLTLNTLIRDDIITYHIIPIFLEQCRKEYVPACLAGRSWYSICITKLLELSNHTASIDAVLNAPELESLRNLVYRLRGKQVVIKHPHPTHMIPSPTPGSTPVCVEYEVFKEFYAKLTDVPSVLIIEISHHLKLLFVLEGPIKAGHLKSLTELLRIMEEYGNDASKHLSCEINKMLLSIRKSVAQDVAPNHGKVSPQTSRDNNKRKLEVLQILLEARKDKYSLKVRYGKVLICGASAAGKTNFLNLLMEDEFQPKHFGTALAKSQKVLAMKVELSTSSNEKIIFKKMDIDTEIVQFMKYLPKKCTLPKKRTIPSIQKPAEEEEQRIAESEIQRTCTITEDIISSKLAATVDTKTPVKSLEKVWDILTFIDTGGQPQFISMLPAVNHFAMITFIVHNMTGGKKSLTQKVVVTHGNEHGQNSFKQQTHEYTYHQLIKTLMSFASSLLLPDKEFLNEFKESTVGKDASISFIGTHSNSVSQNDIKEIDDELVEPIKLSSAGNAKPRLNKNYTYLVPLDNKAQGKDLTKAGTNNLNFTDPLKYTDPSAIRDYIHEWLKEQDIYSVPVQWLLLDFEIRKLCIKKDCSFLTYDEVIKLSRDKELGEDDFIKNGLRFHHFFGVLLYFEIEGMPELIITDHQWLFKKLTEIVLYSFEDNCATNVELDKLRIEGIFKETLLNKLDISKDFEKSGIDIKSINPKKYFLELLQHLRIVASLNKDPTQYFMPSLLKSCDLVNLQGEIRGEKTFFMIEANKMINSEPLLIQFNKSFDNVNSFPRGVFCFLVVQLIHCTNWEIVEKSAHDNMLSFIKQDTVHYITLIDRIFYLEVHVRPYKSDYNPVNDDIFITIKDIILTALSEVGSRLDIKIELECGFQCKYCEQSHIALKKRNPECYFCIYGNPTRLEKSHKLWFKACQDSSISPDHKSKGHLKPTIKQLQNFVTPRVAAKWHEVGIELYRNADVPQLDTIQKQCPGDYRKACTEMLTYWLNTYTNPTWNRLIKALKAPGLQLNAIALDIMIDVIQDQTEDDDSGVPAVTDDDSGDTPAVEKLTDTSGVDKLSEAHAKSTSSIPQLKGSSSTYVSSTSINLWTRSWCCLAIVVGVAAVVIAFALSALGYSFF